MKINENTVFTAICSRNDATPDGIAFPSFLKEVLSKNSGHMTKVHLNGTVSKEKEYFLQEFEKLGGRLLIKEDVFGINKYTYIWETSIFEFEMNSDGVNIYGFSLDEKLANDVSKLFKDSFTTPAKQGYIFAIMRYASGLQLQQIGYAGTPLEKDNYSEKVIKDYEYIIKDLRSPLPSGRIAILDGAPGCGKSFMVRAILTEVPDALFVLIPPNMVAALGGPELLPLLLQYKQNYHKEGPTVFILEDADHCLVPRGPDNMDSISAILNLGDGIFGSLFDIRIIATTNAKRVEMDSAIIRAGRLSKRIEVEKLSYLEANRIFQRLLPEKEMPKYVDPNEHGMKPKTFDNKYSLAEVYKAARDAGWLPPVSEPEKELLEIKDKLDLNGYFSDDE